MGQLADHTVGWFYLLVKFSFPYQAIYSTSIAVRVETVFCDTFYSSQRSSENLSCKILKQLQLAIETQLDIY